MVFLWRTRAETVENTQAWQSRSNNFARPKPGNGRSLLELAACVQDPSSYDFTASAPANLIDPTSTVHNLPSTEENC